MSPRLTPLLLVAIMLALMVVPGASAAGPAYECEEMVAHVYNDGSVNVTVTVLLGEAPEQPVNITITTIGTPVYAEAVTANGTFLPVAINHGLNVTVFPGIRKIRVTYLTLDATSKIGEKWILEFNSSCEAKVYLPEDAVPARLEPEPRIVVSDEGLALVFPAGHVQIEYYLAPAPSQPTTQVPGGATGGGATGSPSGESTGGNTPTTSTLTPLAAAVAGAAVALGVLYVFLKRRGGPSPGSSKTSSQVAPAVLDDRDRSIVEAVRQAGPRGLTASEIMSATGIPKTPLYRRLNRLVREGVLEAVEEGGVRRYRLKG